LADKISVGGQAVLEGVMMRSPKAMVVAVRRPDGSMAQLDEQWRSISQRVPILKKPFLRGTVVLVESLMNGLQALSFSAKEAFPEEDDGSGGQLSDMELGITIAVAFVFAILLFVALPHAVAYFVGERFGMPIDTLGFHLVDGVVKVSILVAYILSISAMKDIRRVFQYHGAEHMSIHTYEADEELTVPNAKKYSTLHPRCGTAFLLLVLVVSVFLFAAVFPIFPPLSQSKWLNQALYIIIKIPLIFPIAGITYEIIKWGDRNRTNPLVKVIISPGLALQKLTTRKPTDDQLEVALFALKLALAREAKNE